MSGALGFAFFVYIAGLPFALFGAPEFLPTRARWAWTLVWPLFVARALVRGFKEAWRS